MFDGNGRRLMVRDWDLNVIQVWGHGIMCMRLVKTTVIPWQYRLNMPAKWLRSRMTAVLGQRSLAFSYQDRVGKGQVVLSYNHTLAEMSIYSNNRPMFHLYRDGFWVAERVDFWTAKYPQTFPKPPWSWLNFHRRSACSIVAVPPCCFP